MSSVSRLKNSPAKSKMIILLTDGMNNAGKIDPVAAARVAASSGVKIYTIGAGTKGFAPFPVKDFWGRRRYQNVQIDLDETTLNEIARLTNGRYFRATDTESLKRTYVEIDALEKSEIEQLGFKEYRQLYGWFLGAGLMVLFFQLILVNTIFMTVP
jgi:Ca-activated chloride channel family protein